MRESRSSSRPPELMLSLSISRGTRRVLQPTSQLNPSLEPSNRDRDNPRESTRGSLSLSFLVRPRGRAFAGPVGEASLDPEAAGSDLRLARSEHWCRKGVGWGDQRASRIGPGHLAACQLLVPG